MPQSRRRVREVDPMKIKELLILASLAVLLPGCDLVSKAVSDAEDNLEAFLWNAAKVGGVILLVLIVLAWIVTAPHMRRMNEKKKRIEALLGRLREKYREALKAEVVESERKAFLTLGEECLSILDSASDEEWKSYLGDALRIRHELERMLMFFGAGHVGAPAPGIGEEIERLAHLRQQGIISDREFAAFSERFTVSSTEKARGILETISSLHEKRKKGALTDGNYRDALWSLLDKLDRKT